VDLRLLQDLNSNSSRSIENTIIVADKQKICQVVRNLISNALKFTPRHSGKITISFVLVSDGRCDGNNGSGSNSSTATATVASETKECNSQRCGTFLRIQVKDNGVGISQVVYLIIYNIIYIFIITITILLLLLKLFYLKGLIYYP